VNAKTNNMLFDSVANNTTKIMQYKIMEPKQD